MKIPSVIFHNKTRTHTFPQVLYFSRVLGYFYSTLFFHFILFHGSASLFFREKYCTCHATTFFNTTPAVLLSCWFTTFPTFEMKQQMSIFTHLLHWLFHFSEFKGFKEVTIFSVSFWCFLYIKVLVFWALNCNVWETMLHNIDILVA